MQAQRYAQAVDAAGRHLPVSARCLARSLALHWWLRSDGVPSSLKIGVAKEGAALRAHAWVDLDGVPVNGTPAEVAPFTPLTKAERALPDGSASAARLADVQGPRR
jgi:hypothetical protein